MSAPDEGRQRARAHPRTVPGASYAPLSSRALQPRPNTVIDVQEVHRVLECSQLQRRFHYQQLVRQYTGQILVGCKNPNCETVTCFSRNARNATRPYRPPSQLTAHALANYLASQDDPYQALCPHRPPLKNPDTDWETNQDNVKIGIYQGNANGNRQFIVYPTTWKLARQYRRALGPRGLIMPSSMSTHDAHTPQTTLDVINSQRQLRKDVKSLGQNLYNSLSMMAAYTQQIANPSSVLTLLRASTDTSSRNGATHNESAAHGLQSVASSDTTKADHEIDSSTSAPTVMTQTREPPRIVRERLQQQSAQCSDKSYSEQTSQHVPGSDGHQIHRIPYQPVTAAESKATTSPNSAGTRRYSTSTKLSIKKTGKKSFTLGGGIESDMGRSKPPVKVLCSSEPRRVVDRSAPTLPVFPILNCDIIDNFKEHVHRHRKYQTAEFNYAVDYDNNRHYRPTTPLVNRSLFYTLSDPETLLKSFRVANREFGDSPLPHLDSARLTQSFRDWSRHNGALIFDSLWMAVEALFTPPPELVDLESPPKQPLGVSRSPGAPTEPLTNDGAKTKPVPRYLTVHEAAHIVVICIHALTSLVPVGWPHVWLQVRKLRSWGIIVPTAAPNLDTFAHPFMDIIDGLEYEPALRLADRLLRAIGARMCFEHILKDRRRRDVTSEYPGPTLLEDGLVEIIVQHLIVTERVAIENKRRLNPSHARREDPGWTVTATFLEWSRTVLLKKWDSKPQIPKWGSVGVAVQLHEKFYVHCDALNLRFSMFEMPFLSERIDSFDEPLRFLDWEPTLNHLHVYQYPCFFSTHQVVTYFRTINFTTMFSQYNHTVRTQSVQRSLEIFLRGSMAELLSSQMQTTFCEQLFLTVSRENALEDTLDMLWGQEKRMLLKPLKVKIGTEDTGDYGTDLGGVTNEYFSLVLGEAFRPENGMFTIDPQTRMTWFQPGSLEAPWKFEMIGLLFSIAVYNGVTLPVTFPLAFYHMMLSPVDSSKEDLVKISTVDFIKDGWPDLAKSFGELLSWSDGDVGEVIMRDAVFSYEVFGHRIDHNMAYPFGHDPLEADSEPEVVTNANREEFVGKYIYFLTYASVETQLVAFKKGFLTCLQPKSLRYFSPAFLRKLVEGSHDISMTALRRVVDYDEGYTPTSATVRAFWKVAESYDQEDARRLLEFVTASNRIPVTGYENVMFKISKVGGQPHALPSSSTCFGRLYLPDYADVEVLRQKLGLAITHSRGFGVL